MKQLLDVKKEKDRKSRHKSGVNDGTVTHKDRSARAVPQTDLTADHTDRRAQNDPLGLTLKDRRAKKAPLTAPVTNQPEDGGKETNMTLQGAVEAYKDISKNLFSIKSHNL